MALTTVFADWYAGDTFTDGIQEAIDALPAPSGIGLAGAVWLSPGVNYSTTKTIWLHPGVVLMMNGATIQRATGSITDGDPNFSGPVINCGPRGSNGTQFSSGNKGANIYIVGPGVIDGNQSSFTALTNVNLGLQGIRCLWTQGLYISNNIRVQNCLQDGIYLSNCLDWMFDKVQVDTVGQWSVVSSRNALSLTNNDNDATYSNRGVMTNFDFKSIGDEGLTFVGCQGVTIKDGTVDGCDFGIEFTGTSTVPFKGINIGGVDFRNLRDFLITFNQSSADVSRCDFGPFTAQCDPTNHDAGIIYAAGSGYNVSDCRYHHIIALDVNSKDTTARSWIDFQSASGKSRSRVFVDHIEMIGLASSTRTGDVGVIMRHPCDSVFYDEILIKDIAGIGFAIDDAAADTQQNIHVRKVVVDGANYDGFRFRNDSAAATIKELYLEGCVAKDCAKQPAGFTGADSGFKILASNAGSNITKVKLKDCRSFKTSGSNHKYGLTLTQGPGALNDVEIDGCDFSGCVVDWFSFSGTPTNVRFRPPSGRGTDIASAATIAIPADGTVFHVTGTTNITAGITVKPWDNGRFVELVFDSALTISNTGTSKLDGNFKTVSGNVLVLFCDGTNWNEISRVPQTKPHQVYPLVLGGANTSTPWTVDPAGAGTFRPFGGANLTNLHLLDFSYYTEARLHARCKSRAINVSATVIKIVDTTNSKDVTNTSSFSRDGNWHTQTTGWLALDAATIGGLATFELEGSAGSNTDILDVGTIILELRRS